MKLITLIALIALPLISNCVAVSFTPIVLHNLGLTVGPYNVTVDLLGFGDINAVGPIQGAEGIGHVSYMVGIAEGNSATPTDNARRFTIDITKFGLPIDLANKVLLSQAYDETARSVYPNVVWDTKGQVMIDEKLAAHYYNKVGNIHFICYFATPNLKVTIGEWKLTSEEFTRILGTLHVATSSA